MTAVAIYARVSSEQQATAKTIQSQVNELSVRAKADGAIVPEEMQFTDDGYSGAALIRPALERLRDSVAAGAVTRLYVHSPDRLARKYAYQMLLVDEFQRAGVELIFLNKQLGKSPEDDLLLQVQGMIAEYERAKILERSRRGKLHAARQGSLSVFSGAPYGYRYVSKTDGYGRAQWEIQFEEARVVRQMFEWVGIERLSLYDVALRLQAQGIKTAEGKVRWYSSTISRMLKNSAYVGKAAFGKKRMGPRRERLRPIKGAPEQPRYPYAGYEQPKEEQIVISVPRIVSDQLFEVVQEQLEENRRRKRIRRSGPIYLLQGLIVCKLCGYAVVGKSVGDKYAYYRCSGKEEQRLCGTNACANKQIRTEPVDNAVWSQVCAILRHPEKLKAEFQRRLTAADKPIPGDTERIHKQIAKVQNGVARLIDSYTDGLIEKKDFESRMAQTKSQLHRLQEQEKLLADQEQAGKQLTLLVVRVEEFANKVRDKLQKLDNKGKREIIKTLVKRVEVHDQKINIVFKIDPSVFPLAPGSRTLQDCNTREGERLQ